MTSKDTAYETELPADERTLTLRNDVDSGVFDLFGDIRPAGLRGQGVYHRDVRHLSKWILTVDGTAPLRLGSTIRDDDVVLRVDLTNPPLDRDTQENIPQDTIHFQRESLIFDGRFCTRIRAHHFGNRPIKLNVRFSFDADFADIFEVRGFSRPRRGEVREPDVISPRQVDLKSIGLDEVQRTTFISFRPAPSQLSGNTATYSIELAPTQEFDIVAQVSFEAEEVHPFDFDDVVRQAGEHMSDEDGTELRSSNDRVDLWIERADADLRLMLTNTDFGRYPYAGLPWFNSVFGRDGIWTALMSLWTTPSTARGVLEYLAAHQAQEINPAKDAEPGRILHEHRESEMAMLGEVPFRNYYGTIDATPLFVILAEAYYRRTGDLSFITSIWDNIQACLRWISDYGDADGDGFVEYQRTSPNGILSQGWKDSDDAISHQDGDLASPPIALCEVQGYAYAARISGAFLAKALGEYDFADQLLYAAEDLQRSFETAFWCDEIDTYALALDATKTPCRVKTSNAGHCLFAGIVTPPRDEQLVRTLFSPNMFSGWGIRTLATDECRYNPLSYHNGSVWPHDNAIIAFGLSKYGYRREVLKLLDGMYHLGAAQDLQRMPELICGFGRRRGVPPVRYPLSCAPQAWSASAVLFLIQASLGMELDALNHEIRFTDPVLPDWLPRLVIRQLRLNGSRVDLSLEQQTHDVSVNFLNDADDVTLLVKHGGRKSAIPHPRSSTVVN